MATEARLLPREIACYGNLSVNATCLTKLYSYECDEKEIKPILFFHIPKTGGTTFTGILFAMAHSLGKPHCFIPGRIGQFEEPVDVSTLPMDAVVYAGHCHYKFAQYLPQNINRIALVRHPVDRVVSEYFWLNRDRDEMLIEDQDRFLVYLKNLSVNNLCCRMLSVERHIDWNHFIRSIDMLEEFFCFGTTQSIAKLGSFVLSKYGASSIVTENAKVANDPRQAYFKENFSEYILDFNSYDYEIYNHVLRQENEQRFTQPGNTTPRSDAVYVQNMGGKSFEFRDTNLEEFD